MKLAEILTLSKKPVPDSDFSVLLSREQLEAKEIFHTRQNTFYVKITRPAIDRYFLMGLVNSPYFNTLYRNSLYTHQGNTRNTFLELPFRPVHLENKEEKLVHDRIFYGAREILKIQAEMNQAEDLFLKRLNTSTPKPSEGSLKDYIQEAAYGALLEGYQEDLSHVRIRELLFEEEITQGAAGDDLHFGQTNLLKLSYLPQKESITCPLLRWRVEDENLKLFLLFAVPQAINHLVGKAGLRVANAGELLEKIRLPFWFSGESSRSVASYNQEQIIILMEDIRKEYKGVINPSIQMKIKEHIKNSLNTLVLDLYCQIT